MKIDVPALIECSIWRLTVPTGGHATGREHVRRGQRRGRVGGAHALGHLPTLGQPHILVAHVYVRSSIGRSKHREQRGRDLSCRKDNKLDCCSVLPHLLVLADLEGGLLASAAALVDVDGLLEALLALRGRGREQMVSKQSGFRHNVDEEMSPNSSSPPFRPEPRENLFCWVNDPPRLATGEVGVDAR